MAKAWKLVALLLVVTILVWLTTMWRWQSAQADPSGRDVLMTLVALPALLTIALAGAVWAATRLRRHALAPLAAPLQAAGAEQASADATSRVVPDRHAHLMVLGASAVVRAGADWATVQQALASGKCLPELHPHWRDDDGVAVFTAAMADLDVDAIAENLAALAAREGNADIVCPEAVVRALALADRCLTGLDGALSTAWSTHSDAPSSDARTPAAVALHVGLPVRWSPSSRQIASAWLNQRLQDTLAHASKFVGAAVQLQVHAVEDASTFMRTIDAHSVQWHRHAQPGCVLVLSIDSAIDEHKLTLRAARDDLFSGQQPQSPVPGEGAAALLLASPAWPRDAATPPLARLHRGATLPRDKSADAPGRIDAQVLQQAWQDALQAADLPSEQVAHLTSDTDLRGTRTTELFDALRAQGPHLDTTEDIVQLGTGCGDLGIAAGLLAVALAADRVASGGGAGLVVTHGDPWSRTAIVLTPPTEASPARPDLA